MSLVRDPDAAARYAADPAGALAAAGLPGVTVTDVQNLMPVVADSLAMSTPTFGTVVDTVDVWTSGAASAALDAFDIPHPAPVDPPAPQIQEVPAVDVPAHPSDGQAPAEPAALPDPAGFETIGQTPLEPADPDWADHNGWAPDHGLQPDHPSTEHPGFDIF